MRYFETKVYTEDMDQVVDWLQALGGLAVIPCAVFSFANWRVIRRELRPNGGESMFDRVTRIEHRLTEVDHLLKQLGQHQERKT